jgi:hypothetical protein
MFGVIMVICFTSVLRPEGVLSMYFADRVIGAALACCVAWGLVDGIFYVWEGHYELRKKNATIQAFKQGRTDEGMAVVTESMEDTYLDSLNDEERERALKNIADRLSSSDLEHIPLKNDVATILAAFALVVGTAVFVLIPFLLIQDISNALFFSNLLCIIVLFGLGYWRAQGQKRLKRVTTGTTNAIVGIIITAVTVALGG